MRRRLERLCLSGALFESSPGVVGIELGHSFRLVRSIFAEIFLEDHSVLIDDECLDTRFIVLCRIRNIAKSAGHLSIDNIRLRAALGIGTLTIQPPEVIAIEWLSDARLEGDSLFCRECHQWSKRAARSTLRRLPVQAILLAGIADEFLRVL